MGGACSRYGERRYLYLRERVYFEDPGVDMRII